jgi:hypothetical protein
MDRVGWKGCNDVSTDGEVFESIMDLRGGWKRIDRRDIAGHRGGEAGARLCVGRRGLRHKTVLFVTH